MSVLEVARVIGMLGFGEMVEKWENGPTGTSPWAGTGLLAGFASGSSPAMNLVRRPSIHEPSLSRPGLGARREPMAVGGSMDGVPVRRSSKSSRLAA